MLYLTENFTLVILKIHLLRLEFFVHSCLQIFLSVLWKTESADISVYQANVLKFAFKYKCADVFKVQGIRPRLAFYLRPWRKLIRHPVLPRKLMIACVWHVHINVLEQPPRRQWASDYWIVLLRTWVLDGTEAENYLNLWGWYSVFLTNI